MRQLLWIICVGSGSGLLSFNQCLTTLFQIFPSSFVTYVSEVLCFKISISVLFSISCLISLPISTYTRKIQFYNTKKIL